MEAHLSQWHNQKQLGITRDHWMLSPAPTVT